MMTPDKIFLTVNDSKMSLEKLLENTAAATDVRVYNCPGLSALPELPAATDVWVYNCPGLSGNFYGGEDPRGYKFFGAKIRGQWRIMAGCRNFTLEEALEHWAPKTPASNKACLTIVKQMADQIAKFEAP